MGKKQLRNRESWGIIKVTVFNAAQPKRGDRVSGKKSMRNMTEGSCWKNILLFALPMLAGNLLQQAYNLVDSWVVGNYVGDGALAAVGVAFPVLFLFISLFQGISTGSTVVISQFFGAGRMDRVKDAVTTTYTAFLIVIFPLTAVAVAVVEPLLILLNIDQSAFAEAKTYMIIVCAGLVGNVGYNVNAGILRGLGDSRTPLLLLVISTVINVVLDFVTVILWHMGVAGVAYATIIAQGASWLFGIFYINRKYSEIHLSLRFFRFDKEKGLHFCWEHELLRQIIRIGLPAGMQTGLVSIGIMTVMGRVNSYGEAYTAAYNVGQKLDGIAIMPIQSIAAAATAFVGQNMGANKPERVKQGTKATLIMVVIWSLVVDALILPFREPLAALFSDTPEVIRITGQYVAALLPFYPFFGTMFSLNSIMRGAGESMVPMMIAFVGQIICRVPAVYLLAHFFGPDYMFLGFPAGWVVGSILASLYYRGGRWKRHGSIAAKFD